MSFASPAFLPALLVAPAAIALYVQSRRKRRRYAVRFPGVDTLASLMNPASRWRRHLPAGLFTLALAALALALARPQTTVAVPVERATVVLVTDSSRSMLATDVDPSRLDAARQAGHSFLDRLPDSLRVGFVGFSDAPHTVENPTTDHDTIRGALDELSADGATATGEAVLEALEMLEDRDKGRRPPAAMVLLSDGKVTTGSDPVAAARQAGRVRVPIYTVALGTSTATVPGPYGTSLPVPPDPETLRRMASVSGGRAFETADADELDRVYESLSSQIGTREEKREITAGFAAGGIALLLAAAGLSVLRSARLP